MKTIEQIKQWLTSQEWWEQFEKNFNADPDNTEGIDVYLKRLAKDNSLEVAVGGAFFWDITEEGQLAWDERDELYRTWFNS